MRIERVDVMTHIPADDGRHVLFRYRSILGNIHFTLDKTWGELIENDESGFLPRLWHPGRPFETSTNKLLSVDAANGTVKRINENTEENTITPLNFSKWGVDGAYASGMGSKT